MIYKVGDNIISSLGFTTEENFRAVKSGTSGVKQYEAGVFDLPEAFMASLIDRKKLNGEFAKIAAAGDYTDVEKAAILSVSTANREANIDLSSDKTIFILSTTKGNVDKMSHEQRTTDNQNSSSLYLWHSAKIISDFFGNKNTPLVVSNACISGAAAQVAAMRGVQSGRYDYAVIVGVDFLSKFIISGFQSFKALSPELCRPFDKARCGLNLGEAAATIIYARKPQSSAASAEVALVNGAIRNDANHISAPSRTGEGSYRALKYIIQHIDIEDVAFVSAHGTATSYNDAAEVNAIARVGLAHVPLNSLKPIFGHTLGAAGVLESIISMKALTENLVPKSSNFSEQDFESRVNIAQENHFSDKPYFIKMLSGFGGGNAVLIFKKS